MISEQTIQSVTTLAERLRYEITEMLDHRETELEKVMTLAYHHNKWYTLPNQIQALSAIAAMLSPEKLSRWLKPYSIPVAVPRTVGIIMAGNVPAVGFHDLLCVLLSGHHALIKCASEDNILMQWVARQLAECMQAKERIRFTDRLKGIDAVIATGSDNSARYFEFYFSSIPRLIRKNRNSVAILLGNETTEQLKALCSDFFSYFGLGCRNVSKIYIPTGYDFNPLFAAMQSYSFLLEHNKYMNNYDYHRALYLMNREPFLTNNFVILKEDAALASPVSVIYYSYYENEQALRRHLNEIKDKIQCIVSVDDVPFGKTQQPELWDYADGVDTLEFLLSLPGN
jgi:hypothetical protein